MAEKTDRKDESRTSDLQQLKLELEIKCLRNQLRLQELDLSSIHPYRFYSTSELKPLLKGRIKMEELRKHGLKGFAAGYWGKNVIDAINRSCGRLGSERALCSSQLKEEDNEITAIFEKEVDGKDRSILGYRTARELEDSGSRSGVQFTGDVSRNVESFLSEYDRLTGAASATNKTRRRQP